MRDNLPFDFLRCRDATCPRSSTCARYLYRKRGAEWTPHTDSGREGDEECTLYIDVSTCRDAPTQRGPNER